MWEDFRSKLYFQAVWAVVLGRPKIAMIENSNNIASAGHGLVLARIVLLLVDSGYHVEQINTNTLTNGLPQNRKRLYLICIRKDVMKHEFIAPKPIPHMKLSDLLIPRERDPGHRDVRPNAPMAAYQVGIAAGNLPPQIPNKNNEDTIITEHCSVTFQPNPKPTKHCPALTSAKQNGHWLMEKSRNMTVPECARILG